MRGVARFGSRAAACALLIAPSLLVHEAGGWLARGGSAQARSTNPALKHALATASPAIARYYRAAGYRTIWVDEDGPLKEATVFLEALKTSADDGLEAAAFDTDALRGRIGWPSDSPDDLAALEVALSEVFLRYAEALSGAAEPAPMIYVDQQLRPPRPAPEAMLAALAKADDPAKYLRKLQPRNTVYASLRSALERYRRTWGGKPSLIVPARGALAPGDTGAAVEALRRRLGLSDEASFDRVLSSEVSAFQRDHGLPVTGLADKATLEALNRGPAHYEALIRANMHRARSLPADLGRRYLIVNTASAELRLVEKQKVVDRMAVIVGRSAFPTPEMAGLIRFLVLNPYWNLPPDLAAERAKRIARHGPGLLAQQRLEILSGWTPDARRVAPEAVDWPHWREDGEMRMRQLPGNGNMMGRMKFMLPNRYGIYLHDTPNKSAFARDDRRLSAGCVRVADADRLARWLMRGRLPDIGSAPEERIDLPQPVPVYLTYFTVEVRDGRAVFLKDGYRRDPATLAMIARQGSAQRRFAVRS